MLEKFTVYRFSSLIFIFVAIRVIVCSGGTNEFYLKEITGINECQFLFAFQLLFWGFNEGVAM